ncbi:VOC family protein [Nocardioides sp. HM23]|uniref:VOC family protein n=1 Tax=Nocardioides bizhenqiangii TaxID=3095076 RepID=UPI002ACA722E|nr:VOC family protein [Nocardioides sp. HM23]MDZ5619650.1 VOC family protein [Nocardioides sp. HM23]
MRPPRRSSRTCSESCAGPGSPISGSGPTRAPTAVGPADFVADISLAYSGALQLELIRPVSGVSIYTEHLERHGAGLHHVCVEVDDLADAVAAARAAGHEIVQEGSMGGGGMEFAYVDTAAAGASYVELARIGPEIRAFYETLRHPTD